MDLISVSSNLMQLCSLIADTAALYSLHRSVPPRNLDIGLARLGETLGRARAQLALRSPGATLPTSSHSANDLDKCANQLIELNTKLKACQAPADLRQQLDGSYVKKTAAVLHHCQRIIELSFQSDRPSPQKQLPSQKRLTQWTTGHLDRIHCVIQDVGEVLDMQPTDSAAAPEQNDQAQLDYVLLLANNRAPKAKACALSELLPDEFQEISNSPAFTLGGCTLHRPDCILFFRKREPSYLGYLHRSPANARIGHTRPRRHSKPAKLLFQGWLSRHERARDLSLMVTLLSIGQVQASRVSAGSRKSVNTRLLVTESSDPGVLYLYEAAFDDQVFRGLSDPDSLSTTWPPIQRQTLSSNPPTSFKRRLQDALR